MARNTTKSAAPRNEKRVDLATAEQTNGALRSGRSVYDICGIKDVRYREKTFAAYQARLRKMNLIELHDHAYELALSCSPSLDFMVQRLEEKYLKENPEERALACAARQAEEEAMEQGSNSQRAKRILARMTG